MIDATLLALLRCPETQQTVAPAPPELVARLEAARVAGELRDRSGTPVATPIHEGLVRADGAMFFPVLDGIPVMIAAEALPLPPASAS